jgi:hypothetical protein
VVATGHRCLRRQRNTPDHKSGQFWKLYQQCLGTDDPTEFVLIIDRFERVRHAGTEPPSWMKAWGPHVKTQPLRTSVDPQALGAACTLRAAAVMTAINHPEEARALYQRVLARYGHREWTYYVDQAKEALAGLSDSTLAVVASPSTAASSR